MTRYYKSGDCKLPSVTTIISDCTDKSGPLTQWAANQVVEWIRQNVPQDMVHSYQKGAYVLYEGDLGNARFHFREVSKEALDVGSAVHHAIEHYLKSGEEPKDPPEQVLAGFIAFLEWADSHQMKTKQVEATVYGDYWAGTLDWYGVFEGEITVIDFKTSKALYPEYRYQIAAYRSCTDATASGVLRLDKETGMPEYKDYSKSYEKDLAVFNAMVNLYMLRHPRVAKGAGWGI